MLAFLEYLYTDHCSIEEGDSVGILVLSNEYMMPRLTSLCELCIQREVDRTTSKCIAQADIDVICKYNTPLPSNLHTLIPSPRTIIPPPSYHHTPTLIPSYPYPCPYAAFQVGGCGNVIKGTIFQIIYMLAGFICRFIDTHALQLSVYGLIYYSHI